MGVSSALCVVTLFRLLFRLHAHLCRRVGAGAGPRHDPSLVPATPVNGACQQLMCECALKQASTAESP